MKIKVAVTKDAVILRKSLEIYNRMDNHFTHHDIAKECKRENLNIGTVKYYISLALGRRKVYECKKLGGTMYYIKMKEFDIVETKVPGNSDGTKARVPSTEQVEVKSDEKSSNMPTTDEIVTRLFAQIRADGERIKEQDVYIKDLQTDILALQNRNKILEHSISSVNSKRELSDDQKTFLLSELATLSELTENRGKDAQNTRQ